MKKNGFIAGVLAVLIAFAAASCANPAAETAAPKTPSLQDVISTTDKTSVDLSSEKFELKDKSEIIVAKAITVTGGASQYDLKGATVKVKASGAKLENVKGVKELIIDAAVGDGDVTVKNCDIAKLTVNGGGANSIHIENVKVTKVEVAKEGVRLELQGKSEVANVEVKVKCVLDSNSAEAKIASVKVAATVNNIEIKGKTKIEKMVAATTDFKVTISSNDVKVEAAVVKTEDGQTSKVTVEAAEGVTVEEIAQLSDEELEELTKELDDLLDDTDDEELEDGEIKNISIDETWNIILFNLSPDVYEVISHDENSIKIQIFEDLENEIHVEYNLKDLELEEIQKFTFTIKADSTDKMFAGYWADNDTLAYKDDVPYSPEGIETSIVASKAASENGVFYFIPKNAGTYEFSKVTAVPYELPSTSEEGHLVLEAVEEGIKVTVRLLDDEGTPSAFDNFDIIEKGTGIGFDLEKPGINDNPREISGIFPFVKENEKYEFEYTFSMKKDGTEVIPWHVERAGCKATATVLDSDEYFDFDYSPANAKLSLNNKGYFSIDKDIAKFFKKTLESAYIDGGVYIGTKDPWNANWITSWSSVIENYSPDTWKIIVDYDLLSSTGFPFAQKIALNEDLLAKLNSRDTCFILGTVLFTIEGIDTKFKMGLESTGDVSTDMFNPFAGNTYTYYSESYEFTESEVTYKYKDEISCVYSYSYNSNTHLLSLIANKIKSNVDPDKFVTLEEYVDEIIGIMPDEQQFRAFINQQYGREQPMTDDEWEAFVNSGKTQYGLPESASYEDLVNAMMERLPTMMSALNRYYLYELHDSTLKLSDYINPELTLKDYFSDYQIPDFSTQDSGIRISGNEISVKKVDDKDFYTIVDVTDSVIKVTTGAPTGATIDIPYKYKKSNPTSLKITFENQDFELSHYSYGAYYTKQ